MKKYDIRSGTLFRISSITPAVVLAMALAVSACNSDAVSSRTDLNKRPDNNEAKLTSGSIPGPLDINNDALADFTFERVSIQTTDEPPSGGSHAIELMPRQGGRLVFRLAQGSPPVDDGVVIPTEVASSTEWTEYSVTLMWLRWSRTEGTDSIWRGPWAGVSKRCMPLEIQVNGAVHYGWARLSCDEKTGSVTLHEFAYQPAPGVAIRAGERP